jgi:hypothetical protein
MARKLRLLTLVTMAEAAKVLPYPALLVSNLTFQREYQYYLPGPVASETHSLTCVGGLVLVIISTWILI